MNKIISIQKPLMKKSLRPLLLCVFALMKLNHTSAQEAILPSENMVCLVTVTPHMVSDAAKAAKEGKPVPKYNLESEIMSIRLTRTGKNQHNEITWGDGSKSDVYLTVGGDGIGGKIINGALATFPLSKGTMLRENFSPAIIDLTPESLAWINSEHADGEKKYKGKPALHYQMRKEISAMTESGTRHVLWQAWVDPKTHLPLAFDNGDALYELEFLNTPPEPVIIPDQFQKLLQQYTRANAPLRRL